MSTEGLDAIFAPRSVAVIGASRKRGSIGAEIFHNLLSAGFTGAVYPVNSKANTVQSVKAYRTVADIPEPVDLAIVATPAIAVPGVIDECIAKGVRAAVIITGGFAECGTDGAGVQQKLLERCRAAGLRLVGPNCLGVLSTDEAVRLNATFAPCWPAAGGLAFASQSGALGLAALDSASELGVGIREFASTGNKADVSGNDLIARWRDDPHVRVILLYLESFGNPRRFLEIARQVSREKPIVVVKSGRTEVGARAASSHTAALADSEAAVGALLAQTGVVRVDTMRELFDAATVLAQQPVPKGRRVAILTNAGGLGIMAADACGARRLELPGPSASTTTALRALLPSGAGLTNPIDLIATAGADTYEKTIRLCLDDPSFDAVLALLIPTAVTDASSIADAIARAAAGAQKPVVCGVVGEHDLEQARHTLRAHGVPVFPFPEDAVLALARAADYGDWRLRQRHEAPKLFDLDREHARRVVSAARTRLRDAGATESEGWMRPDEMQSLLAAYGIKTPRSAFAATIDAAVKAADTIGYPAVVKVYGRSVLHKTEVGGVRLGLRDAASVRAACRAMQDHMGGSVEGFIVQEMLDGGTELLAGLSRNLEFGALIGFGAGGVDTELFHDIVFRLAPLSLSDADEMVSGLRAQRLLDGFRGRPSVDRATAAKALLRISALATDVPELVELDLNPLVATARHGLVALDARGRLQATESAS